MSETIKQTITMLEMLPDQEQSLALEIVKRLVLAWDPDFTKLTPEERRRLHFRSCRKRRISRFGKH